jgi:hypothetical protein
MELILVTYGLYLMPFLPLAGAVWFLGRKRVQWNHWDFALALLPFAVWATLMVVDGCGKSLANVVEAFWLGCATPLAPIIRVTVGRHANQKIIAIGLCVAACLTAIGLWAFVPGLPE